MKKLTTNKIIIIILSIWVLLAIIFAFYDLSISSSIVNQDSTMGKFVAGFGELPGLFVAILAFFMLSANIKSSNKIYRYLLHLPVAIITLFLIFYFVVILLRVFYIPIETLSKHTLSLYLFFGCVTFGGIYLFKTKLKKFSTKNYAFAKITSILFSASFLLVQTLKTYWGRIRFSDLAAGFTNFTPWYLPQGITGGHSFPSGHTLFGWMLLPLVLLTLNKKKWKKTITIVMIIFWGIFVASNRVYFGAHYASDVLFSSGFTIILFLILYKKYRTQ